MLILTTDSIYSVVKEFFKRSRRKDNLRYLNNKLIDAEKRYIETKEEGDKQKADDLASKVGGFIIRI